MMATLSRRDRLIRRLRYRAARRGTREMDLLLGRFADHALDGMTDGQLRRFETLLAWPDPEIAACILDAGAIPEDRRSDVLELLLNFHKR